MLTTQFSFSLKVRYSLLNSLSCIPLSSDLAAYLLLMLSPSTPTRTHQNHSREKELESYDGCLYCQSLEEVHITAFQNSLARTGPMALLNYNGVTKCGRYTNVHGCSVFLPQERRTRLAHPRSLHNETNNETSPSCKITQKGRFQDSGKL